MTEHTKGPWFHYFYPTPRKRQKDAAMNSIMQKGGTKEIVHWGGFDSSYFQRQIKANARRIVACVNALEGIPTEALEAGAIKEVVEAVRMVSQHWDALPSIVDPIFTAQRRAINFRHHERLQAAIAKLDTPESG